MCDASALISGALGIGSALFGHGQQKAAAAQANAQSAQNYAYALQQQAVGEKYRTEMIQYGNEIYARDISYGGEVLDYQRGEFDRQVTMINKAREGIDQNYIVKIGTLLQRQVEEQIASAFGIQTVEAESRAQRAKAQVLADARGVEGNSVDAILGDIQRQEGDAVSVLELNRSNTQRQLALEALSLKAESDQSLYNLPFNTYAPSAPISAPSPVSPVGAAQPPQYTSGPSGASLALNIGSALVGSLNGWTNRTGKQLFKL